MTNMMNRLGNAKNPYQNNNVKKVLTICSAGLLRSPTAAKVIGEAYGFNTRSAGISEEYALIPVDEVLVHWADELVFMEQKHFNYFKRMFKDSTIAMYKIKKEAYQILDIPDKYSWMSDELVDLIENKYDVGKVEI